MSAEEIVQKINKLKNIIYSVFDIIIADKLWAMIEEYNDQFFLCPCSSNINYHRAYPGGLLDHCLQIYENLKVLNTYFLKNMYSEQTIAMVALFHDLGKCGELGKPVYIPETNQWKVKNGNVYRKDNSFKPNVPHSLLSVMILEKYNIPLTNDEKYAIIYHDGQYVDYNKCIAQSETPLMLITHWADMFTCLQDRKEVNIFHGE